MMSWHFWNFTQHYISVQRPMFRERLWSRLACYVTFIDSQLPTLRERISVPNTKVNMETIGRLQISVTANQLNVMYNKNEDFIYTTAHAINPRKLQNSPCLRSLCTTHEHNLRSNLLIQDWSIHQDLVDAVADPSGTLLSEKF